MCMYSKEDYLNIKPPYSYIIILGHVTLPDAARHWLFNTPWEPCKEGLDGFQKSLPPKAHLVLWMKVALALKGLRHFLCKYIAGYCWLLRVLMGYKFMYCVVIDILCSLFLQPAV